MKSGISELEKIRIEVYQTYMNIPQRTGAEALLDFEKRARSLFSELDTENQRLKEDAKKCQGELNTALHDEIKRLRKALTTIIGQPFKGSWDAQAVFIQNVLAGTEGKSNEDQG